MLVYHLARLCALRYGDPGYLECSRTDRGHNGDSREGGEQKVRPNDKQPQEGHRGEPSGSANDERARGFYMVLLYTQDKYV